jgi:hypothetical protein
VAHVQTWGLGLQSTARGCKQAHAAAHLQQLPCCCSAYTSWAGMAHRKYMAQDGALPFCPAQVSPDATPLAKEEFIKVGLNQNLLARIIQVHRWAALQLLTSAV